MNYVLSPSSGVAAVGGGCARHHEGSERSPAGVLLILDGPEHLLEGILSGVENGGQPIGLFQARVGGVNRVHVTGLLRYEYAEHGNGRGR